MLAILTSGVMIADYIGYAAYETHPIWKFAIFVLCWSLLAFVFTVGFNANYRIVKINNQSTDEIGECRRQSPR